LALDLDLDAFWAGVLVPEALVPEALALEALGADGLEPVLEPAIRTPSVLTTGALPSVASFASRRARNRSVFSWVASTAASYSAIALAPSSAL
jgi:hypothetical protein